jgi:hypothetical protein
MPKLPDLPRWVWDLVADVVQYEEIHGTDKWPCMDNALARVPADVRRAAEVIARYRVVDAEIVEEQPE